MPAPGSDEPKHRRSYMIFSIQGDFCHESRSFTASKNIAEFLLHEPEDIQFDVVCQDTGETFSCFGKLVITGINEHRYECPDSERQKWARQDHAYNKHVLAHLGPTKTKYTCKGREIPAPTKVRKKPDMTKRLNEFLC